MSIILIGGLDRMHREYTNVCQKHGHKIRIYTQLPTRFSKIMGMPDGMVFFMGTMSHKMVNIALKEAKRKNIPIVKANKSSINSMEEALKKLESMAG